MGNEVSSIVSFGGLYEVGRGAAAFADVPKYYLFWVGAQYIVANLNRSPSYTALGEEGSMKSVLKQSAWNDRIISQLHCIVMGIQAWRVLFTGVPIVQTVATSPSAPMLEAWRQCVQWSFAYYLHDILRMVYNRIVYGGLDKDFGQNLLHHMVMFVGHTPLLLNGDVYGLSAFGYLAEMSTPVLNYRWMLQQSGAAGTAHFLMVTKLLGILFFVFRILLFPTAFVINLRSSRPAQPGKAVHAVLWAMCVIGNSLWFKALLRSIRKGAGSPKTKGKETSAEGKLE